VIPGVPLYLARNRSNLRDRGEMTMKLKMLFIVMDLLTILAIPFVFLYGTLRQFLKSKESPAFDNLLVTADR
jgi:hypothetical protein